SMLSRCQRSTGMTSMIPPIPPTMTPAARYPKNNAADSGVKADGEVTGLFGMSTIMHRYTSSAPTTLALNIAMAYIGHGVRTSHLASRHIRRTPVTVVGRTLRRVPCCTMMHARCTAELGEARWGAVLPPTANRSPGRRAGDGTGAADNLARMGSVFERMVGQPSAVGVLGGAAQAARGAAAAGMTHSWLFTGPP